MAAEYPNLRNNLQLPITKMRQNAWTWPFCTLSQLSRGAQQDR
jgi:hypothetical protein